MTKLLSMIIAAMFAAVSVSAIAQDKMEKKGDKMAKKPSAEECKKDPKMKGCEMDKKMDKMEKKGDKMDKMDKMDKKGDKKGDKNGAAADKK